VGRAADTAVIRVDLPALGMPNKPTSARTLSSSCRERVSPSSPGVDCLGARFTDDLKL